MLQSNYKSEFSRISSLGPHLLKLNYLVDDFELLRLGPSLQVSDLDRLEFFIHQLIAALSNNLDYCILLC